MSEIPNIKQKLIEGWLRTRGQKRTQLHVSPQGAYEYLDSAPPTIDERKLSYFLNGEIKHLNLQICGNSDELVRLGLIEIATKFEPWNY